MTMRRGAYPGTFNPPTVAHLAVAVAARSQCGLDRVELILSETPLGKHGDPQLAPIDVRLSALQRVAADYDWLTVTRTDAQLLVDVAADYDVVILGADKWAQVIDPVWYGTTAARDSAMSRLPHVALAPRPPHPLPVEDEHVTILNIDPEHHDVSATAVRAGRRQWLAPGAESFVAQPPRDSGA
jgi:hypothetical protein